MRPVLINNVRYTAVNINAEIFLTDENLNLLYSNFHSACRNGFEGSFTDYCTDCFVKGASLHFLEISGRNAGKETKQDLYNNCMDTDRRLLLYEN